VNPWLFFSLLVGFIVVSELPVRVERPSVSPRFVLGVRVGWYGLLAAAVLGWWFGIDIASWVLGLLFVSAALNALLTVVLWIGTRRPPKGADSR
jgi:hypothetical protein